MDLGRAHELGGLAVDDHGQRRIDDVTEGVLVGDGHQREVQLVRQGDGLVGNALDEAAGLNAQAGGFSVYQLLDQFRQKAAVVLDGIGGGDDELAALEPDGAVGGVNDGDGGDPPVDAGLSGDQLQSPQGGHM